MLITRPLKPLGTDSRYPCFEIAVPLKHCSQHGWKLFMGHTVTVICVWLSGFSMFVILSQNYAGSTYGSCKIMRIKMFASLHKERPSTKSVRHLTRQQ
jgi:hypothetical protein